MKIAIYHSKKVGEVLIKSQQSEYTIYSNRLEARSLNQEEEGYLLEKYSKLLGSAENTKMFGEGRTWEQSEVKEFLQEEIENWKSGKKFSVLSIYHSTTQEFMGYLHVKHALNDFSHVGSGHENVAEIAYAIDQPFWGKGYGTEIAILGKKFIKHILSESEKETLESHIEEIVATVHPLNEGSKKILQKTLKHQEPEEFAKFGDKPRLLFFKKLKKDLVPCEEASLLSAKL